MLVPIQMRSAEGGMRNQFAARYSTCGPSQRKWLQTGEDQRHKRHIATRATIRGVPLSGLSGSVKRVPAPPLPDKPDSGTHTSAFA